ncbi:hypothetical protein MNBD_BACTEROID03-1813 [hydrothermal vent metagenome]|uniref:DUF3298 domain-containing protein n=1 Tax=hydrothermal vent metagenome TaxID=652676 RepID=A0A3B0SXX3_9ZZZZ
MKTVLTYLSLFLILSSCKNENKLTFEPLVLMNEACDMCPEVSIEIPKAIDRTKLSETINTALREEIISLLLFDDEIEVPSLEDALTSFKNGYLELQRLYTDESTEWEVKIDGKIVFENASVLTIELNSYLFTGGAHGYTSKQYLNFDKNKGVELENWQLFKSKADFQHFAEAMFRLQEKIPQDKPINYTGFMFEKDSFYLPENIGFTKEGIKLRYNQYEVASYADGTIELTLPYKDVKKYLSTKIKS